MAGYRGGGGGGGGDSVVPATFVVGEDRADYPLTQAGLVDAIAALPAEGGEIWIGKGTLVITSTITLPDKPVTFVCTGDATVFSIGANAIALFTIPDTMTAIRNFVIRGGKLLGTAVNAQRLVSYQDSNAYAEIWFYNFNIEEIQNPIEFTAGDVTFLNPARVHFTDCYLPPVVAGGGRLAKAPNDAGTYDFPCTVFFVNCDLIIFDNNTTAAWRLNFDGDIIFTNTKFRNDGSVAWSQVNGLTTSGASTVDSLNNEQMLEVLGGSHDSLDRIDDFVLTDTLLKVSSQYASLSNIQLFLHAMVQLNAPNLSINGIQQYDGTADANNPIIVDVLAGADNCTILDAKLQSAGGATPILIRTAAQHTSIVAPNLAATGAIETIVETGGADYTLVSACQGINTGGGATITGANSVVLDAQLDEMEISISNVTSSTYATSGVRYIPLAKVANPNEEYVQFQFQARRSGRVRIYLDYAPSVSNGGDVQFDYSGAIIQDGDDPNAALSSLGTSTFTPGAGATRKTLVIDTTLDVVPGDDVVFKILRDDDAADTHTGSMNILTAKAVVW